MIDTDDADESYSDDPEFPDDADMDPDDDESTATDSCPYCGHPIYIDALRCPHCGKYLSEEDTPTPRKHPWLLIGVILCLIVVVLFWLI